MSGYVQVAVLELILVLIEGMPNFNSYFDLSEHCLYGKRNRVKFSSGATRAKEILCFIHNHVFGPIPIPSLGDLYIMLSL